MNVHYSPNIPVRTSRAAEGLARRCFTVEEILAMEQAEIFHPSEKFELIEGEIVPMNANMSVHELIKSELVEALALTKPKTLRVGIETSIFLSQTTFVNPDICLYAKSMASEDLRGPDLLLVIEVAVSSLRLDRRVKAKLYARYGVRELWVIDAVQRRTFIHRDPSGDDWGSVTEHGPEFVLTIAGVPGFSQRLDAI